MIQNVSRSRFTRVESLIYPIECSMDTHFSGLLRELLVDGSLGEVGGALREAAGAPGERAAAFPGLGALGPHRLPTV